MHNFDFLEKGLGIVSPTHFEYDFSRKMFLMLLPDCLIEILANMCLVIVCFPGCDVVNCEIDIIFLIQLFFYMTKKS